MEASKLNNLHGACVYFCHLYLYLWNLKRNVRGFCGGAYDLRLNEMIRSV